MKLRRAIKLASGDSARRFDQRDLRAARGSQFFSSGGLFGHRLRIVDGGRVAAGNKLHHAASGKPQHEVRFLGGVHDVIPAPLVQSHVHVMLNLGVVRLVIHEDRSCGKHF
jgi:hypothetical protein